MSEQILSPELINDPRAGQLADLVLDYSVELHSSDRLLLIADPAFLPYVEIIRRKAEQKGAKIIYDKYSRDPNYLRDLISEKDDNNWQRDHDRRLELANWSTAMIRIVCDSQPNFLQGVPNASDLKSDYERLIYAPYRKAILRPGNNHGYEVKWNLVALPDQYSANEIGMSFKDYADFLYGCTIGVDWPKMRQEMQKIKQVFDAGEEIRIYVPGETDITFSLKGRGGEICDGRWNMPDGEVYYGPIEDSANGTVTFNNPIYIEGFGVVGNIWLEFVNGVIVDYSSDDDRALESLLNTDEGARRIGEFGIGCNSRIDIVTFNDLLDEKKEGIHLALGESFLDEPLTQGGGKNKSDIHQDIPTSLKDGGQIYVDGRLVQENGVWKI